MTCNETFQYICATDYRSWAAEGREDCPGNLINSGIMGNMPESETCMHKKGWDTEAHLWSFTDNVAKTSTTPSRGGDCGDCYTPSMKKMRISKLMRTQCWTHDNLQDHCNLAGGDPVDAIRQLWGDWSRDILEYNAYSVLRGVFENEKALNDAAIAAGGTLNVNAPGLVYDADDLATNDDPGFFGFCAMIEGLRFLGCKRDQLMGIGMHSDVYTDLVKSGQITMVPVDCDDDNCLERAYMNNKPVFEYEDDCLIDDDGRYITVLFRQGALAYEPADLGDQALGFDEDPCTDGGVGSQLWVTREKFCVHPVGWSSEWEAADPAVNFVPNENELKDAASWCRVFERRNTGLAFVISSQG